MMHLSQKIPIDLLWSEGAAHNTGFAHALTVWATAMKPNGFIVVSEMSWLREQAPDVVKTFFLSGYPDMKSIQQNIVTAENTGYRVVATHAISKEAWVEGYYDILEPRAKTLIEHPDSLIREFAAETLKEIEVFQAIATDMFFTFCNASDIFDY